MAASQRFLSAGGSGIQVTVIPGGSLIVGESP
jgi:hypothetical protein